mmetsp:Transcript_30108/g.78048  ORF Transcript_30108/g.78048 Transcript_30108/m.78048 type:complete len:688 (+) Transcript_30108:64-2127(+)
MADALDGAMNIAAEMHAVDSPSLSMADPPHIAREKQQFQGRSYKIASIYLTLTLHGMVVAFFFWLQQYGFDSGCECEACCPTGNPHSPVQLFLIFSAIHLAVLLNFIGPSHPGQRLCCGLSYWVPDQVNAQLSSGALLGIGIVHFFGVAIIEMQSQRLPCSALESVWDQFGLWRNASASPVGPDYGPPDSPNRDTLVQSENASAIIDAINKLGCNGDEWYSEAYETHNSTQLTQGWTLIDRLYFSIVLTTTVGYGTTFVPENPTMRSFVLSFAVYALIIFGAASYMLGNAFTEVIKRIQRIVFPKPASTVVTVGNSDTASAAKFEPPAIYHGARELYFTFLAFVMLNTLSAFIFWNVESAWTLTDALYHCTMTATTIGLGDIAPQTQGGRVFAIFHMLASVVLFGSALGVVISGVERRREEQQKNEMLRKQLDTNMIKSLDRDGDGVDKAEFVLGMLDLLGIVSESDYMPFVRQFEQLDSTGDGKLDKDDLMQLARDNRQKHRLARLRVPSEQERAVSDVHHCAKKLMVPCAILSLSFVWNNIFGFMFLGSGLLSGAAIGSALSAPPTGMHYRVAALLAILTAVSIGAALVFMAIVMSDVALYFEMDPLARERVFSSFDENKVLIPWPDAEYRRAIAEMKNDTVHSWDYVVTMLMYILVQFVALLGHVYLATLCLRVYHKDVAPASA